MPVSQHRIDRANTEATAGLDRIFTELDIDTEFPPEVRAEAAALRSDNTAREDRRDLPLVTIDPPGATDLDQALAIEAAESGGHIVWYAIADVASFVIPGGAIDTESHRRGMTLYAPHRRIPLHPPALSEDAGSLLPDQDRPAVLWRLQLDGDGNLVATDVRRATVRSRSQLSYAEAQKMIDGGDELLSPLRAVGERRQALEAARGGLSLPVPEQEVVDDGGRYRLEYRATLPVEEWNAQISLLCGIAAAEIMLESGWGLLRTLPPADDEARDKLRRQAKALGVGWADDESYGDVVARLDTTRGPDAAFAVQATRLFRGAGYLPLMPGTNDRRADEKIHAAIASPYAHVTAPLRRLGDRYATECALAAVAGQDPPDWTTAALSDLPSTIQSASSRAGNLERAVVDYVEALLLSREIGSTFRAVVVDHRKDGSQVQFIEPAVVGTVDGELPLGEEIEVRVDAADPATRNVDLTRVR